MLTGISVEPWNFGPPKHVCQQCGAIVWYEERKDKSKATSNPKYSLCCKDGKIRLPILKDAPPFLKSILSYDGGSRSTKFKENIRGYNSIFSFTSTGAKVDNSINVGGGPYVYRISGQNHHLIGSLLPVTGEKPKFAQLYIYDTENEVMNRLKALSGENVLSSRLELDIVSELVKMFDECNDLAKVFRMARDRFRASEFVPIRLRLIRNRSNDPNVYNLPTTSEVAALIVGDLDDNVMRDIIVEHKTDGLQRISELHLSFMAMQYPLILSYGEDGFQLGIKLSFHLPEENVVTFRDTDYLDNVVNKIKVEKTMFTQWMEANTKYEDARELSYADFPTKWENNWNLLSEDILYRQQRLLNFPELRLTEAQLKNHALYEIEKILEKNNRSLKDFPPLPLPNRDSIHDDNNRLLTEELSHDIQRLIMEHKEMHSGLNVQQMHVFNIIVQSVIEKKGGLYFVYGTGGTGKTYWKGRSVLLLPHQELHLYYYQVVELHIQGFQYQLT
ncbi:hypothetical protein Dsin_015847 [Dipteronia sinensis]|uniref:ATP-dependent DNA helicase n=1 Tax=Dipteronia sinensis TaxID=43782 RepID=A0AAE0ACK3_9ROSI|nr:hypothetical protein Dsin_015847 [Dipteronia sinensis]